MRRERLVQNGVKCLYFCVDLSQIKFSFVNIVLLTYPSITRQSCKFGSLPRASKHCLRWDPLSWNAFSIGAPSLHYDMDVIVTTCKSPAECSKEILTLSTEDSGGMVGIPTGGAGAVSSSRRIVAQIIGDFSPSTKIAKFDGFYLFVPMGSSPAECTKMGSAQGYAKDIARKCEKIISRSLKNPEVRLLEHIAMLYHAYCSGIGWDASSFLMRYALCAGLPALEIVKMCVLEPCVNDVSISTQLTRDMIPSPRTRG